MSNENKTPEMMLQIDFKEKQRRENYRRAEAFLLWKFGPMYDEARRFLRGSGMDWPSLFVEFVEKVEEDLLARMRVYDKTFWENNQAKAQFGPFATMDENAFLKYSPMLNSQEPRKPMRRHWKDDPNAYSPEELEKLKAEDDGERQ
jgi:hypothetical protein